mmetsp:Transcript_14663/g.26397  ORF Transcript_14663/g.26397 Transcript_14663/m.26397 type:complete len:395 (+) Transcript_14663:559-1743(+)
MAPSVHSFDDIQYIINGDSILVGLVFLHVMEGPVQTLLPAVYLHICIRHQQLSVANLALVIYIKAVKHVLDCIVIMNIPLMENILEMFQGDVAVFILVHLIESIVELFLLFLGYDLRAHGSQHQIFQFVVMMELLEALEHKRIELLVRSVGEPCVLQSFFSGHAFFRVPLQQLGDEVPSAFADPRVGIEPRSLALPQDRVKALDDHVLNFLHFPARIPVARAERKSAVQHGEHDDAHAPHVCRSVVTSFEQDLWSLVVERTTLPVVVFVWNDVLCHSEVDDLYDRVFRFVLEQEVVWLQVTMHESILVHVSNSSEELLENLGCLELTVAVTVSDEAVVKLAAFAQLHDDAQILRVFEHIVELDDVRVMHLFHDFDLIAERLKVVFGVSGRSAKL